MRQSYLKTRENLFHICIHNMSCSIFTASRNLERRVQWLGVLYCFNVTACKAIIWGTQVDTQSKWPRHARNLHNPTESPPRFFWWQFSNKSTDIINGRYLKMRVIRVEIFANLSWWALDESILEWGKDILRQCYNWKLALEQLNSWNLSQGNSQCLLKRVLEYEELKNRPWSKLLLSFFLFVLPLLIG